VRSGSPPWSCCDTRRGPCIQARFAGHIEDQTVLTQHASDGGRGSFGGRDYVALRIGALFPPTTGCCDRDKLEEAIKDHSKRTSETAQLLHLLDGLNGYARQLGVRLLVYDLPYRQEQERG